MKTNKYKAKKVSFRGIEFDSKLEHDLFITLLSEQERGKIIRLIKIEKPIVLVEMGHFLKNGKKKKQIDIKYTPDLSFYAIDVVFLGEHLKNKNVIIEVKGKATAKLADYQIRKRMYLNTLEKDDVFLEVIKDGKKIDVIRWEEIWNLNKKI